MNKSYRNCRTKLSDFVFCSDNETLSKGVNNFRWVKEGQVVRPVSGNVSLIISAYFVEV